METIKINDMQTKGVVFIVKYETCDQNTTTPRTVELEATLNRDFNKQEIWYLENEVGIGGTVSVLIEEKQGNQGRVFINITKVDMTSGVKGEPTHTYCGKTEEAATIRNINQPMSKYSDKDRSIIAQCLTKVFCKNQAITADAEGTRFVLESYNYFLKEL